MCSLELSLGLNLMIVLLREGKRSNLTRFTEEVSFVLINNASTDLVSLVVIVIVTIIICGTISIPFRVDRTGPGPARSTKYPH